MIIYVSISELCIDDNHLLSIQEATTAQEISNELSICREEIGKPILVSKKSGLRPKEYEIKKGRSGNSEHSTYNIQGRGAVDLVYYKELLDKLIERNFFTRICYYPNNGFLHCDRKNKTIRQYFEADSPTSDWRFQNYL